MIRMCTQMIFRFLCILACWTAACLSSTWETIDKTQLAMIKDPVIDVFIYPPLQIKPPFSPSPERKVIATCRRAHQFLANEIVHIIQQVDDLVEVYCPGLIYGFHEQTGAPLNSFWLHQSQIARLADTYADELQAIPTPDLSSPNHLLLLLPWQEYSFDTRFVRAPDYDTATHFGIYRFNVTTQRIEIGVIPREYARIALQLNNPDEARALFIHCAQRLISFMACQREKGVVPYVWGGSSCVYAYEDRTGRLEETGWQRSEDFGMCYGFDCSEFIFRLAHACGIPYCAKNTRVIPHVMQEVTPQDTLKNGDLIWFPGHVMIISDVEKGEIIEARGYTSGYGCVHQLPLSACFANVQTFDDLRSAIQEKKALILLRRDGTQSLCITEYTLFKLIP